jgi:prophage antirepressor-like protein
MGEIMKFEEVEKRVLTIQGQQVLIDRDVAELYGVETKRVNEAVKNNPDKFPEGYVITLEREELCKLVENFDRFNSLKHSTVLPTIFTEKGLYMLATILKSPSASQTTLAIVETFTKIREFARIVTELPDIKEEPKKSALMQKGGDLFMDILEDNMLEVTGDEISLELDLSILKVKRIVKREKKN